MKKNNTLYIILILGLLSLIVAISSVFFYSLQYNEELEAQIKKRDSTILKINALDSIYNLRTKEYSDTITKYIYNCNFYIGDKKITSSELIELVNNLLETNKNLEDSIFKLNQQNKIEQNRANIYEKELMKYIDSVYNYNLLQSFIGDEYGVNIKMEKKDKKIIFTKKFSKADSAMLLLPYYRHKISKNPDTNMWIIITE